MPNPFHPTFGVSPPLLVGRDDLLEELDEALEDGPGAAGRATLYTGARGSGKTVMLNAVEDIVAQRGWAVVSETASSGLIQRISREHLPRLLGEHDPEAVRRRLSGVTAPFGFGGAAWDTAEAHVAEMGLRSQVELLSELLMAKGAGLLITLDEIHHHQMAELRELFATIQHAFRDEREVLFAGAGLASAVSEVLTDSVLTFLRRAERHALGAVGMTDVMRAIRHPVESAGRSLGGEALEIMSDGTQGYPFLIQLVGARTWRLHPTAPEITIEDAKKGVTDARRRLGSLIHEPALAGASEVDRSFLLAMAQDDGPSKMSDLQRRLDVDQRYASQYRLRLIAAELISPAGRGYVDFALPYLREYLRQHAASGVEQLLDKTGGPLTDEERRRIDREAGWD